MSKLFNLARMTTSTVGTGTMTLVSAVGGFLTFAAAGAVDGDVVSYAVRDGTNSEIGTGTYNSAGPTLTRTNVLGSTNSNLAISLSGTAQVFITPNTVDFSSLAPLVAPSFTGPVLINSKTPQAQVVNTGLLTNNDARYRKLIKLVAAPGQFRMTDQPPAEYIDGDLMVARGNIVFPSPSSRIAIGNTSLSALAALGAVPTTFVGSAIPGDAVGKYLAVRMGSTNPEVFIGSDASTYGMIGTSSNHALGFRTNNVLGMTMQVSGGLSIGSTQDFGAGSVYMTGNLQIASGAPEIWFTQTTGATDGKLWRIINTASQLFFDIANDTATVEGCIFFDATRSGNTITNLSWNVSTSGTHIWNVNSVEKMRLDASGNLGIGLTPSGSYKLEVSGALTSVGALFSAALQVNYATPIFYIINSGAATDNKVWRQYSSGSQLLFDITNDAATIGDGPWCRLTRSGATLTKMELAVSNFPVEVNGILKATRTPNAAGNLQVWGGDSANNNVFAQIGFGWNGSFQYQQWIATRHDSGVPANNQIRFFTSDCTAAGVFPTNAILGFTIAGGSVAVGALGASTFPQSTLDVAGGVGCHGGSSSSYYSGPGTPAISMFYDAAGDTGNIYTLSPGVAWKSLNILCNTFLVQAAAAPVNAIFVDASGHVAIGTTTTVGALNINGGLTLNSSINVTNVNAGIELGSTTTSNTPFIDFHSSGNNNDYDARLIATGGTTLGTGSLSVDAKQLIVCSTLAVPAGGSTGRGILLGTTANFGIFFGSGAPTLSAAQGSLYLRSDGIAGARFYINTNSSTGWQAEG